MNITDQDVAELQTAASSGDETAKAILDGYSKLVAPEEKPPDQKSEEGSPAKEEVKESAKEEQKKEAGEPDQPQVMRL